MKILEYYNYKPELLKEIPEEIFEKVKKIITDVKERGDKALLEYTEKFDGIKLSKDEIKVSLEEMKEAFESLSEDVKNSILNSINRIKKYQESLFPKPFKINTAEGVSISVRYTSIPSIGIYVPGGASPYISTVLMATIPAKVAKVKRCVITTPPKFSKEISAIAYMLQINEVYRIGGAQAIAALAYGTESIKKVEKIVGPGNVYVTAAKILVSKDVAIDMPAGPSELVIYAEDSEDYEWLAMDMMAQAEHDIRAKVILITPNIELANKIKEYLEDYEKELPSLSNALIILVKNREEAANLINEIAPEHLEIICKDDEFLNMIENAGAIFIGKYSPTAIGDYTAGSNHILPTMGWAKKSSPLSVLDFLKITEIIECTKEGLKSIGKDAIILAKIEKMKYHEKSISIRMMNNED
ncbi:MAG: histidinol dehydrogenase [Candidatus Methanomethylicaceae archaeon]